MNFRLINKNFKLLNNEKEKKDFVIKYDQEFEYIYNISFFSRDSEVNKDSVLEYFNFMCNNLKLNRFLKDYILVLSELELEKSDDEKLGNMYVEIEEFYALPDQDFQNKKYYDFDQPCFLENNKVNTFLYNVLYKVTYLTRNKKYLSDGIILDKYNVDEEVLKKFLGLKCINAGTEFEFEFLDDQGIRRLYKCKLLDYKKEIRTYCYNFYLFMRRSEDNFNDLNFYDQNYINNGYDNYRFFFKAFPNPNSTDYKNMLDFFFEFFDEYYNYYLNNINNLETLSNLLDYEKNKDKILSYIQDYSKQLVSEDLKKQLDISDIKNFNKEYAHYLYLKENYKIFRSKLLKEEYVYGGEDWLYNLYKNYREDLIKNFFFKNEEKINSPFPVSDVEGVPMPDRYLKENIWVKGYGKYLDLK